MKKTFLSLFACFLLIVCLDAQDSRFFTQSIYFDSDVHSLDATAQAALNELVATLNACPDFDLKIEAYTDEQGSMEYNNALAERRAASTAQFLLSQNIQPRSTQLKGFGESQQRLATGDIEEQRRINRRVDVLVTAYYFSDLSGLMNRLESQQKDEVFRFRASSEEQRFTSAKGTQIVVPGDAFTFEDGSVPTGEIEFRLREAYEPSAWFLNQLSTETKEGELLQTAGMTYTEATSDGKPLRLKEDKNMTIAVPLQGERDDEMGLYYGEDHGEVVGSRASVAWRAVSASRMRNSIVEPKDRPKYNLPQEVVAFLKQSRFDVPHKMEEPHYVGELAYPNPPKLPNKPRKGFRKPERDQVVFRPSTFRERFYSKKKRTAIEELRFAKKMKNYTAAKERYERKMAEYTAKVATKQADIDAYEAGRVAWRKEVEKRLIAYYAYQRNDYFQRAIPALNGILKNSEKVRLTCGSRSSMQLISALGGMADNMARNDVRIRPERKYHTRTKDIPLTRVGLMETSNGAAKADFRKDIIAADNAARTIVPKNLTPLADMMKDRPDFVAMSKKAKEEAQNDCVASGDEASIRSYVFDVTKMGWCNVDRLMKLNPKQIIALEIAEDEEAIFTVMVPKINAAVGMTAMDNGTYRSNLKLPVGETVIVVAMKVQDGEAQLATHEFTLGEEEIPQLEYQSMPVRELRAALGRLNS